MTGKGKGLMMEVDAPNLGNQRETFDHEQNDDSIEQDEPMEPQYGGESQEEEEPEEEKPYELSHSRSRNPEPVPETQDNRETRYGEGPSTRIRNARISVRPGYPTHHLAERETIEISEEEERNYNQESRYLYRFRIERGVPLEDPYEQIRRQEESWRFRDMESPRRRNYRCRRCEDFD